MAGNEKYSLRFGQKIAQKFCAITVCSALFLILGLWQIIPAQKIQSKAPSTVQSTDDNVVLVSNDLLFESDKELYKQIFNAQKTGNWEVANSSISKLSDKLLLGDVLADRYLHRHYDTSSAEIINWLKAYSDHLQASEMLELANSKFPDVFLNTPKREKQQRLQGYGDANGDDIRFDDNPAAKKLWSSGLEACRKKKKMKQHNFFLN